MQKKAAYRGLIQGEETQVSCSLPFQNLFAANGAVDVCRARLQYLNNSPGTNAIRFTVQGS